MVGNLLGATRSAQEYFAITKSDVTTFASTRGLYVGTSGDVYVDGPTLGTNVKLGSLAAGMIHSLSVTRVYSTGTTASDIVGLR
jgi:hypothetical protein